MTIKTLVKDDAAYIVPEGTSCSIALDQRRRKYRAWLASRELRFDQCRREVCRGVYQFELDGWLLLVQSASVQREG